MARGKKEPQKLDQEQMGQIAHIVREDTDTRTVDAIPGAITKKMIINICLEWLDLYPDDGSVGSIVMQSRLQKSGKDGRDGTTLYVPRDETAILEKANATKVRKLKAPRSRSKAPRGRHRKQSPERYVINGDLTVKVTRRDREFDLIVSASRVIIEIDD